MLERREPRLKQFVVKATDAEDALFARLAKELGITKVDLVRRCLAFAVENDPELARLRGPDKPVR